MPWSIPASGCNPNLRCYRQAELPTYIKRKVGMAGSATQWGDFRPLCHMPNMPMELLESALAILWVWIWAAHIMLIGLGVRIWPMLPRPVPPPVLGQVWLPVHLLPFAAVASHASTNLHPLGQDLALLGQCNAFAGQVCSPVATNVLYGMFTIFVGRRKRASAVDLCWLRKVFRLRCQWDYHQPEYITKCTIVAFKTESDYWLL